MKIKALIEKKKSNAETQIGDISLDPEETDDIKSSSHPETPFEVKEAFSQKAKLTRLAYAEDSVTMEP